MKNEKYFLIIKSIYAFYFALCIFSSSYAEPKSIEDVNANVKKIYENEAIEIEKLIKLENDIYSICKFKYSHIKGGAHELEYEIISNNEAVNVNFSKKEYKIDKENKHSKNIVKLLKEDDFMSIDRSYVSQDIQLDGFLFTYVIIHQDKCRVFRHNCSSQRDFF